MRGSLTHCPGCGVQLPDRHIDVPDRFNASGECFCAFSDLQCYTVAKRDPAFIHQHAVDAYEAQHAGGPTRNITVAFGLIGLYLALEKGYTGRQVQQAQEDRAGEKGLAPAGTSGSAGFPDGHGCADRGNR